MYKIKVTKMQGCGNDFVILDYGEYEKSELSMSDLAIKLCDRNFGIGADGMIIPELRTQRLCNQYGITDEITDIGWYFFNSDGTTAQMCGNGIRCFAKYVFEKGLVKKRNFSVATLAGVIRPEILRDGTVKVNMSKPILDCTKIPFKSTDALNQPLMVSNREFTVNAISMGNPHCVIFNNTDEDIMQLAKTYGPEIEKHELFPEKTNVEFIKIKSRNEIDLRVFERGCGITLACGTGACASVVAGILNNLTDNTVKVNLPGGALTIDWQGSAENRDVDVFMCGPAEYSFFAEYIL